MELLGFAVFVYVGIVWWDELGAAYFVVGPGELPDDEAIPVERLGHC